MIKAHYARILNDDLDYTIFDAHGNTVAAVETEALAEVLVGYLNRDMTPMGR